MTNSTSLTNFDPRCPMHRAHPEIVYEEAREHCPVMHVTTMDSDFYCVTRAADVTEIVRNRELWRSGAGGGLGYDNREHFLSQMDDMPVHDRRKAAVIEYFLPKSLNQLKPKVEAISEEIFADFLPNREGDFVKDVAFLLPVTVIAEILGAPKEDRELFKRVSTACVAALNGDAESRKIATAADAELEAYLDEKIDEKVRYLESTGYQQADAEDLLTHMVRVWKTTGRLSRWECNKFGRNMLSGGHESTTAFLSLLMMRLVKMPEVAERLRQDPALIPVFVEEVLRLDGPVQGVFRTNRQETVLHGTDIPEESKLQILFAAANRDPEVFDNPDEFSIDRDLADLKRKNFGFGIGIHFCIGGPVARIEGEVAVRHMLKMRDVELAGEPEFVSAFILRGYSSLPIRWSLAE